MCGLSRCAVAAGFIATDADPASSFNAYGPGSDNSTAATAAGSGGVKTRPHLQRILRPA
jgi:hypothetical protein